MGGDAGARAPNPAWIGATGRYPHLSSPRHLSTPHLPSPLPTPAPLPGQCSPKEMAVGARAERLRGSPKTITAPRHHCALRPPLPQPRQATPFPHARLIAPAVCAASDSGSPKRAQRGWRAAGARRVAHRRVRAPSPPAPALGRARRLLLGRLGARCALWRQLRAGGSSPTCSPTPPTRI